MKLFKDILKLIKKYNNIVIARHIGADPDALGSQFALKELIKENFKEKNVYAVGATASKFRFMGILDKPDDIELSETLLIVLDTPDKKRIDGIEDIEEYGNSYSIPSPNNKRLMGIFKRRTAQNNILNNPYKIFEYLREFPQKSYQTKLI